MNRLNTFWIHSNPTSHGNSGSTISFFYFFVKLLQSDNVIYIKNWKQNTSLKSF